MTTAAAPATSTVAARWSCCSPADSACENPGLNTAMSWKPNSAWMPGSTMRASFNRCEAASGSDSACSRSAMLSARAVIVAGRGVVALLRHRPIRHRPRRVAQTAQLVLAHGFPVLGYWTEPSLLGCRLEAEPPLLKWLRQPLQAGGLGRRQYREGVPSHTVVVHELAMCPHRLGRGLAAGARGLALPSLLTPDRNDFLGRLARDGEHLPDTDRFSRVEALDVGGARLIEARLERRRDLLELRVQRTRLFPFHRSLAP